MEHCQLALDLVKGSQNNTFKAELCLSGYLLCAKAEQPARMCETLYGHFAYNLHITSSGEVVFVFLLVV